MTLVLLIHIFDFERGSRNELKLREVSITPRFAVLFHLLIRRGGSYLPNFIDYLSSNVWGLHAVRVCFYR